MDADFPAAHSMDTQWFAIDSDGCVGYFVTGEPGPIPAAAKESANDASYKLLKDLFFAAPGMLLENSTQDPKQRHIDAMQPPASLADDDDYEYRRVRLQASDVQGEAHIGCLGMLLRSQRLLEQLERNRFETGSELATPGGTLIPVFCKDVSVAEYRLLHDGGECVACVDLGYWFESPERIGIFLYSAADHYEDGPYELEARPTLPMVADRLPPEIRRIVGAMQFNKLRFGDAQYIQPLEHMPCAVWGDYERSVEMGYTPQYMASDGSTLVPLTPDKIAKW